jgi:hypothetical protein
MAKRTGGLPTGLKGLDTDELECIERAASALNLSLPDFMVHARFGGEKYLESVLSEYLHKHRGGPERGGPKSKGSADK